MILMLKKQAALLGRGIIFYYNNLFYDHNNYYYRSYSKARAAFYMAKLKELSTLVKEEANKIKITSQDIDLRQQTDDQYNTFTDTI